MRHLNVIALLGLSYLLGWAWMRMGWLKFGEDKEAIEELLKRKQAGQSVETQQDSTVPDAARH